MITPQRREHMRVYLHKQYYSVSKLLLLLIFLFIFDHLSY
jgi:hypothetical protein